MRFPAKTGNENVDEGLPPAGHVPEQHLGQQRHRPRHRLRARKFRSDHGIDGVLAAAYPFESVYTSRSASRSCKHATRCWPSGPQRRPRISRTHG